MRSLFDPLPRPLSTKTLAVLVGLVILGTGVAVARFLEYAPTPVLDSGTVWAAPAGEPREAPRAVRTAPSSRTQESSACETIPRPSCSGGRTVSSSTTEPTRAETPALFQAPVEGS